MTRSQRLKAVLKRTVKVALRPAFQRPGRRLGPEHWGITADPSRGLVLEDIALHDLLDRWGSPLHVVHARRLRENARRFMLPPPGSSEGCEVFYSYKSNPVPSVLSMLHALGVGAEVISPYELWLARRLGVPPEKIVYNGPAKSPESIREAIDMGIGLLTFNHREEIATVVAIAEKLRKRVRVGLRVTAIGGWTAQFGMPARDGSALEAFADALASPWLQVVGLHVHRGGMLRTEEELSLHVEGVLEFEDTLREKLGLHLERLDFGGSLGLPTGRPLTDRDRLWSQRFQREVPPPDPARALSIERYVAVLVGRVEAHCRERGAARPRIFVEPGRSLTGDAQLLLARVVTIKRDRDATYAVLDAGINLAESVRSEYHQLLPVNRHAERATRVYTVVGPICTPGDTLYPAIRLPELEPGDSVAVMDAGAYFVPFSTAFSFPRPAIVSIDAGGEHLLRRAERFEDLVSYDEPLPRPEP